MAALEAKIRAIKGVDLYDPVQAAKNVSGPKCDGTKEVLSSQIYQIHWNSMPHHSYQVLLQ
jgi:hypothetical protein